MNFFNNYCLISCLLVIMSMTGNPVSAGSRTMPPFSRWKVVIFNQLNPGQTLLVHCKSKDDDLGDHLLKVDEQYLWEFKENIISTTRFWCTFTTSSNKRIVMDVFWPETHHWLAYRCNNYSCVWVAQDDGMYLTNIPESKRELVRKWDT